MGKVTLKVTKKRCCVSAIGMENKPVMSRVYITLVIGLRITNRKELYMNVQTELGLAVSQILNLDFMSTHSDNYHRLKNNPSMISQMIEIERKWKNVPVFYIPKTSLNVSSEELDIKNGDIIAITTNIKGLDVVHTGFACWVDGKLHLLHASSVMKKVILDSQTLFEYSKNKKAHTGVRVISFSSLKNVEDVSCLGGNVGTHFIR